ncbi:hypothetical protein [Halorussus amylolyticus]|uniref:hypothetical protein n=1 Tax=Halorussus amylolyticus TaxID=1126242 RepID=UPI00104BF338|nr:hypothetical protein [Halorussus amylolyticus]
MGLVTVVLGIGLGLVVAYIGMLTLTSAIFYGNEVRAALKSVTEIETADGGLTKIRGTVTEADATIDPAVTDESTVVSSVTRSVKEGVTGALGSWDETYRIDRMVPFRVEDETGTVLVDPTDELEEEALEEVHRSTSTEFDAGEVVPNRIENVFSPASEEQAVARVVNELDGFDGDDREQNAAAVGAPASTGNVESDGGTVTSDVAQRFEERHVSPGDEVYVIGQLETDESGERRVTNGGLLFRILTEKRNGAVFGHLGYSLLFGLITLFLAVLMKNLVQDLIPEMLALF